MGLAVWVLLLTVVWAGVWLLLQKRDDMSSRAYIGQYSADGAYFVAAYQVRSGDSRIGGWVGAG
jgi:hypothetical protein